MNSYDVEIVYKSSETGYDTLYPQTTDDNVMLFDTISGEFEGDTVADALIELKQSVPSLEVVEQATPIINVSQTGLITVTSVQEAGYVNGGTKTATYQIPNATQAKPVITFNSGTGLVTATVTQETGFTTGGTQSSGYRIPSTTQSTPSISVSNSGMITSSITQPGGWLSSGETKSATSQLSVQSAQTWTPGTSNKTIGSAGYYLTGVQTIKGDINLVSSNIKNGVTIFGVTGTSTGSSSASWRTAKNVQFENTSQYPLIILIPSQADVNSNGHVTFNSDSIIGADYIELDGYATKTVKMWGGNSIYFYILHQLTRSNKINCSISPSSAGAGYLGVYGYGYGNVGNSYTTPSYPITVSIEVKDFPFWQGG